MEKKLPFINFSLTKLLDSEPNTFEKAKIKIFFTVLVFSVIKALVVIIVAFHHNQSFQAGRALVLLFFFLVLMKFLLASRSYFNTIAHIMIFLGLLTIWSIVYISAQTVNIVTLQFVFMLILSSFYLLGTRTGTFYALFGILPIVLYIVSGRDLISHDIASNILTSPGYELLVVLNFFTIITSHYLFHRAFVENVEEKETLNLQLQVAVNEANLAAKSKSDFLSTMSHELRTPLNSVLGITDVFLDNPDSSDREENLKILKFSASTLYTTINDILDFNKLSSNKLSLEAVSVNLYQLIHDVCAALQFTAREKKIDLLIDVDKSLKDKYLITDSVRITQIIYNLVGNGLKFTSKGSVSVRLELIGRSADHIHIKFSVIDTGIGISNDQQELIFDAFSQASSSTSRNFGGTGLGLAIVKQLLSLFNSEIQLESVPGAGSNFFFEITFKLDKEPALKEEPKETTVGDLSHLKILVAEDNLMNRMLLEKIFVKWNNKIIIVENGEEAIKKASEEVFDVILMDLYMPVVDGYMAARQIRALPDPYNHVCIIAFTASVSHSLNDDIKAAGMNGYIAKPFDINELYSKLRGMKLSLPSGKLISEI
jgi:signal transduction histidine kinase/ActR/RegA family two-component response regulator